jgi:putative membrane protein
MFHDGSYMVGMHGLWWLFSLIVLVAFLFLGRVRLGLRSDRPRESPHEVLRRRLAGGDIAPEEYERRKALLDRDSAHPA